MSMFGWLSDLWSSWISRVNACLSRYDRRCISDQTLQKRRASKLEC
jgi:hypothetical protein